MSTHKASCPSMSGSRRAARRMSRALHAMARAWAVATTVVVWIVVAFELWVRLGSIPRHELAEFPASVRFLDAQGQLLREVVGQDGMRADWQPLHDISPLLVEATIAVEDARFWAHDGIDRLAVLRAARDSLAAGRVVSGASTLSMQLARLIEPSRKSLPGKLHEMVRARRLERTLDKQAILEQYLNRAPYGAGTVGVEAASRRYFGKASRHLSLAEAALLAGLPKAPSRLNPLRFPGRARARQEKVLGRLLATGRISREEHDRALAEPLIYSGKPLPLLAMHATDLALARLGPDERRGHVRTTIDRELQADVERAVAAHVQSLALGGMTNAAVIVLDHRTCQIRALVGSADYWADEHGAVNGALAPRQPGSTLKPFTYALAFEDGHGPASVVADIETEYGEADGSLFRPRNFSGTFSGPVLMADALGRSLNVPAIRVANEVGADALLRRLRSLGFASLWRPAEHYGLGLTLGNGEVTLLELAQAYAALGRQGRTCTATILEGESTAPEEVAFSPEVSFLITDILSDESLRITAFGPANSLLLGFPVAVKTGTSSNWRDSWAIGYTDRHTVAVWSGNFDGSSMNHLAGATGAGPLFHTIMTMAAEREERRDPLWRPHRSEPPPGVVEVEVCALSGKRPSGHCSHARAVHVLADHAPAETCDWHQAISIDARNGLRAGELCPDAFTQERVFEVLPADYAEWQATSHGEPPPGTYSPLCPQEGPIPGSVVITYPRQGETFLIEPGYDRSTQTLRLAALAHGWVQAVTWRVDGKVVDVASWPYGASWPLEPGEHVVSVSAPGQRGHEVAFNVLGDGIERPAAADTALPAR